MSINDTNVKSVAKAAVKSELLTQFPNADADSMDKLATAIAKILDEPLRAILEDAQVRALNTNGAID